MGYRRLSSIGIWSRFLNSAAKQAVGSHPERKCEASSGAIRGGGADSDQMPDPPSSSPMWSPHSRVSSFSHHQRPARKSSPSLIARVHGSQPTDG